MAHWAGQRDIPDAPYATNAKWPEPWQPWQRANALRQKRGTPTVLQLEDELRRLDEEQQLLEKKRNRYIVFQTILEGDLEPFKEAMRNPASLECQAPRSGCTPLMVAAASGEAEMCRLLIEAGADLHARDLASGATPFIMAANKGKTEVVHLLLEEAEKSENTKQRLLQEASTKGETALMAAAKAGHLETVKALLDTGAAIGARARGEKHITALHLATIKGQIDVMNELIDRGAVLEDPDDEGVRPLMHAAANGHAACVTALLQRQPPPDLEATDERGRTAVLHAAASGFVEVLEALEAAGAEIRVRSLVGSTGLLMACRRGHKEVVEWWLTREDRLQDLQEQRLSSGETPLHVAIRSGSTELVEMLLDRGAMLEQQDSMGRTPLSCAAAHGLLQMVKLLVKHGASLIITDHNGRVARKIADMKGHTAVAEFLRAVAQRNLVHDDDASTMGD